MMRAWIVCAAFALAFVGGQARAQTPSEEALVIAREIVLITQGERAMREMVGTMRPLMMRDLAGRGLSQDHAERYTRIYLEEFEKEYPRVLELSAIAYAGAFSLAELREIHAFYSTPTGRAMSERMPEITAAMTRAGVLIAEEITPRTLERFNNEAPPGGPS